LSVDWHGPLNKLQDWANVNGFKFSRTKTACMHFCFKRKHHDDPKLHLDGIPIKVVKEIKFLGHTNLISCSSDFVPKKFGASERYDNFKIKLLKYENVRAV
jgi:hypothetical protein